MCILLVFGKAVCFEGRAVGTHPCRRGHVLLRSLTVQETDVTHSPRGHSCSPDVRGCPPARGAGGSFLQRDFTVLRFPGQICLELVIDASVLKQSRSPCPRVTLAREDPALSHGSRMLPRPPAPPP